MTVTRIVVACSLRHPQARSWLTRPMRDRQVRLQWLQGNEISPPGVTDALFLICCSFSSRAALRVDSKEEVALTMEYRQVFRSSARVDHSLWLVLPAHKYFFNVSLKRFFGAPLFRWPEESSPYMVLHPRNMTCPT